MMTEISGWVNVYLGRICWGKKFFDWRWNMGRAGYKDPLRKRKGRQVLTR